MSIFNKYTDINSLLSKEALEERKYGLSVLIDGAKEDIASYEEQLKAIVDRLKDFATSATEAVQEKAEETVETVKKTASKKSTKKDESKTEDESEEK